jgi:hypothetical protein
MNHLHIEAAVRHRCDWFRNRLIPEAPVRCRGPMVTPGWGEPYESHFDYFADYVSISDAGYATELEVKVSKDDWRVDHRKPKWGRMPSYISRFIYVVPEDLLDSGIPQWVPQVAGIWTVSLGGDRASPSAYIKVLRNPMRLGREKVPDAVLARWMEKFYYAYWRMRIDAAPRKLEQVDRLRGEIRQVVDDLGQLDAA